MFLHCFCTTIIKYKTLIKPYIGTYRCDNTATLCSIEHSGPEPWPPLEPSKRTCITVEHAIAHPAGVNTGVIRTGVAGGAALTTLPLVRRVPAVVHTVTLRRLSDTPGGRLVKLQFYMVAPSMEDI